MQDEGESRGQQFAAFAQRLVPEGWSANAILRAAQELDISIQRSTALDVIRQIRSAPSVTALPGEQIQPTSDVPQEANFRWGEMTQETDQWARFDGPSATMFQQLGPDSDEWLAYVIMPEDEDVDSYRFVIEGDEDYVSPNNPGGYRTTASFDISTPPYIAAQRLGVDPSSIVRIIFNRS